MKTILSSLLLLVSVSVMAQSYQPDILGEGFEQMTLKMDDDYDGEVVATLVRHNPQDNTHRAVLYVHGYNDYFFQREMAEEFAEQGWNFYAVDLRNYGRSMIEGQTPFKVYDLDEYYADIEGALDVVEAEGNKEIILMGHSTGGLITSLYCHDKGDKCRVDGLILNSPFFDMNLDSFLEDFALPVISGVGKLFGNLTVMSGNNDISAYSKSLLRTYFGEWSYDTSLKFSTSQPYTAGWLRAIHKGHVKLQEGLDIPCPVLLMYSDNSVMGNEWTPAHQRGDSVLDVKDIALYGGNIGEDVEAKEIKDGLHDLVLSREDVREEVYQTIFEWITTKFKK